MTDRQGLAASPHRRGILTLSGRRNSLPPCARRGVAESGGREHRVASILASPQLFDMGASWTSACKGPGRVLQRRMQRDSGTFMHSSCCSIRAFVGRAEADFGICILDSNQLQH